jgi:hypothetical protein
MPDLGSIAKFVEQNRDIIVPNSQNINRDNSRVDDIPAINFATKSSEFNFLPIKDVKAYTKYGVYPTTHFDYDKARAKAQPTSEQLLNMLSQMATTVGGETLSGIGAIPELFASIIAEMKGGNADFSNALMRWGEQLQEYGREAAPIYRQNPDKHWDIGDLGWWTSHAPSIASSLGLMIPGMGAAYLSTKGVSLAAKLGAVSKAGQTLQKLGKAGKLANALGKAVASRQGEFFNRLLTSSFVMRNGENLKESMMVYNQLHDEIMGSSDEEFGVTLDSIKERYKEDFGKYPTSKEEVAKYIAANGGWRNYGVDAGNIVFDMMQIAPFLRGAKLNTSTFLNPAKIISANLKASGKAALNKGQAMAANMKYAGGILGMEVITEGIEEAVNNIASNEGMHYGRFLAGKEPNVGFGNRFKEYVKDPQLWEEAFWGSIGGGFFAGGSRVVRDVWNTIKEIEDPRSTKNRLEEIAKRDSALKATVGMMKQIEDGTNPFASATEDNTIETPEEAKELQKRLLVDNAWGIGFNAASVGNSNFFIDQVESPEYRQEVQKITNDEAQTSEIISTLREAAIGSETAYRDLYAKSIANDIPDTIKGIIMSQGVSIIKDKKRLEKLIEDYTKTLNEQLGTPVIKAIQEKFDKDHEAELGVNFNDSLTKAALIKLRTDLKRLIKNDPTVKDEPVIKRRTEAVLSKLDERIAELGENKGYKEMASLTNEGLIYDAANKLGNEMYLNGIETEFTDFVDNMKEKAAEVEQQLKEDKEVLLAKWSDDIKDKLDKASNEKDLNRLENSVRRSKRQYRSYPEIADKLEELLQAIRAKKADVRSEYKRRNIKGKPEVAPFTIKEETSEDNNLDDGQEAEDSNIISKGKSTKNGSDTSTSTDKEESKGKEVEETEIIEGEIKPDSKSDVILDEKVEVDYDTFTYTANQVAVFTSAIRNMKPVISSDGVIYLNEENSKIWNAIFNDLKIGDVVYLKYDKVQTDKLSAKGKPRKRSLYERSVGVYDKNDNLLFHIFDIYNNKGTIAYEHMGLVYTPNSNWAKTFSYLIGANKLEKEYNALFNIKLARRTRNAALLKESIAILEKNPMIIDLINLNRNVKIKPGSKQFHTAINHMINIITKNINNQAQLIGKTKQQAIENLNSWNDVATNDLISTLAIRNKLMDSQSGVLETRISFKSPGSVIFNNKDESGNIVYTTIDKIASPDGSLSNTPLLIPQVGNSDSLIPANQAAKTANKGQELTGGVDTGKAGIIYVPLRLGYMFDRHKYSFFKTQFTDLSMQNLPANVMDYNKKLATFILDTINSSNSIEQAARVLRYYVRVTKTDKGNYLIKSINSKKSLGIRYDTTENKVILTKGVGTKNIADTAHREETIALIKEMGISRAVYLITDKEVGSTTHGNKIIQKGEFKDAVTGRQYNSYSDFLIDTGAFVAEYGAVRDNNGNLITNAHSDSYAANSPYNQNLRVQIDVRPDVLKEYQQVEEGTKPSKEEIKPTAYTSLASYGLSLSPFNPYNKLFTMMDTLGVQFDSSNLNTKEDAFAVSQGNVISITPKFEGETVGNKLRLLAHESIHQITNGQLTVEQRARLETIRELLDNKYQMAGFNSMFDANQLKLLKDIIAEVNGNIYELLTYGLTNSVLSTALQSINMPTNTKESKSLARELLDIILDLIQSAFGSTALTEVSNILEEILENRNLNNDNIANSDFINTLDLARVSDVVTTTVGSAIEHIRSFDKEGRAIIRERIKNGTLIFKC